MSFRLKYWYGLLVVNLVLAVLNASLGSAMFFFSFVMAGLCWHTIGKIKEAEENKDE